MKKIITWLLTILFIGSFTANAQTKSKENELVEKVLQNMVSSSSMAVSTYISPAFLLASKVKASDYKINTYTPTGFSVDENKGSGVVVARIWGNNRSWINRLTFIVTYENGNYYLMPGRAPSTYMYIDPWYIVETSITDDGGGSSGSGTKPTATESRKIVTDVLNNMINDEDDFNENGNKYIAPSYYRKESITKSSYQINSYTVKSFEIKTAGEDGMVVALIYGDGKTWAHELTFKVVKESGKLYVYPKGHTDNFYIHPWFDVKTDVPLTKTVVKNEKTELVEKILYAMVNEKDGFDKDMRIYIAPSYYRNNSLTPSVYLVNSYSPVGYSIESVGNDGTIKAKIWGDDRGWVHELTFKVVTESGLLYVMPGKHYTGTEYVDPWFSVRTSITE